MDLAGVAAVLAAVGSILGGLALWLQQRGQSRGSELELAWDMTKDQLTELREEKDILVGRVANLEEEVRQLRRELRDRDQRIRDVQRERDQLQVMVDVLRGNR